MFYEASGLQIMLYAVNQYVQCHMSTVPTFCGKLDLLMQSDVKFLDNHDHLWTLGSCCYAQPCQREAKFVPRTCRYPSRKRFLPPLGWKWFHVIDLPTRGWLVFWRGDSTLKALCCIYGWWVEHLADVVRSDLETENSCFWAHAAVVQSLSCVWLFVTPWTAAWQASLSFTVSRSLLKFMTFESQMPSNHLICCPHLILLGSRRMSILSAWFICAQVSCSSTEVHKDEAGDILWLNRLVTWLLGASLWWMLSGGHECEIQWSQPHVPTLTAPSAHDLFEMWLFLLHLTLERNEKLHAVRGHP